MSPNAEAYEKITARILQALDNGVPPWKQPWKGSAPYNVRSGRPYRGINTLLLALELREDPRWGTFKAWKETGASVRKGEKGTHIVLWKRATSRTRVDENGEPAEYAFMRSYVVFNALQVDNAPALELEGEPFEPCAAAEALIAGMPNRPEMIIGGSDSAFYLPSADTVTLPAPEAFDNPEAFYLTAFHELTHATGAASRLGGLEPATFGSDPYAREELIAEIGAAMLGAACELESRLEASTAYIAGWRRKLTEDPRLIVSAAAESQRRADYIRGISWNENDNARKGETHELATA